MKTCHIKDFKSGWFLGNFSPSILQSKDFEVGVANHKKGEVWPVHYHKIATEYNLILSGTLIIQGKTLTEGDIFVLAPYEIADPIFLTDCQLLIIKTPSMPGDKYEVFSSKDFEKRKSFEDESKYSCCQKIKPDLPLDRTSATVKTFDGTRSQSPCRTSDLQFDDLFTTKPICKQIESEPFNAELIPPSSFTGDLLKNAPPSKTLVVERKLINGEPYPIPPICDNVSLCKMIQTQDEIKWIYRINNDKMPY